MITKTYINPWMELVLRNASWRRKHRREYLLTAEDLRNRLRGIRKNFLGTDCSLECLVRDNGAPVEGAVQLLAGYLGERTAWFLHQEELADYFFHFFYYTIQLYAHNSIRDECLDDLIVMAEAHEQDAQTLATICTTNLPQELSEECQKWTTESGMVPHRMSECVTAAIGVLLGVLPDPLAA